MSITVNANDSVPLPTWHSASTEPTEPVAEPPAATPQPVVEPTEEIPEIEENNLDEFENRLKRLTGGE